MVAIRFMRFGKRSHPTFRVVVSDKRRDTVGLYLELLGTYDPHAAEGGAKLNAERIRYWLGVGAKASPAVHNLLVANKIIEGATVPLGMAKKKESESPTPKPAEAAPAEAPKAEEAKEPAAA